MVNYTALTRLEVLKKQIIHQNTWKYVKLYWKYSYIFGSPWKYMKVGSLVHTKLISGLPAIFNVACMKNYNIKIH